MKFRVNVAWFLWVGMWSCLLPTCTEAKQYQWQHISQQQYVENLIDCQAELKAYQWSKTIWPASNSTEKPKFTAVVTAEELRQSVVGSLYKQAILEHRFNVSISAELLQHDLNRMARDTQDAQSLQQVYALFAHDPLTIAHCVSRPYLVDSKLRIAYDSASDLHQATLALAHNELLDFYAMGTLKSAHQGQQHSITYRLGDETESTIEKETAESVVHLSLAEYEQRLAQLKPQLAQLQEHRTHYSFSIVLSESAEHITLQVLSWQKRPLEQWLATVDPVDDYNYPIAVDLTLSAINKNSPVAANGLMTEDIWAESFQVPFERSNHTAVWTGTEMIIWGGLIGGIELNTGGRYNPTTDSWIEISVDGAPIARDEHIAVWTGSKMVIWGGRYLFNGYNYLSSGGVFDPNTNTWTTTSSSGSPSRRSDHVAVWDGNDVLIWGGYDGATYFDSGYKYNPGTNSWQAISTTNAPSGRKSHTAVWTGDEMIVWGGNNLTRLRSGGIYDPVLDQWQTTNDKDAPVWRNGHSAVWTGDLMIVWGGASGPFYYNTGGMYDPETDSWVETSLINAPSERTRSVAVWMGNEMFLWGGSNAGAFNDGGRFNPNTNSWSPISPTNAPTARTNFTGIWTGTEVIVWGGGGSGYKNDGGRYNPNSDAWQATYISDAPTGRSYHSTIWTGDEMIIWGGENSPYLNDGARYQPSTNTWTPINLNNAPTARSQHIAVWTGLYMVVWGGRNFDIAPSTYFNDGGRYRPLTDSWFFMTNVERPNPRYNHSGVWTGTHMVIWGGRGAAYENTGGRYDPIGNTWTPTSTVNAPAARRSHTSIWTGDEMIVWGGTSFDGSSTFYDDGGRYDPTTDSWLATSTNNAPDARLTHSVVWTGDEMIVWGGGPSGAGNFYQTGGRYNPNTDSWIDTSITNAPSVRKYHSAIWTGTEMIIWGGYFSDGYQDFFNTGGRYDPINNTWQATSLTNAPIERKDHSAVWTGLRMIIWGGNPGSSGSSSTNSVGVYFPYGDLIFADDFE